MCVCVSLQLGSYFGSSVCAVDVNADGLSDLLVGAPLSTGAVREEGRVHVYINQGQVSTCPSVSEQDRVKRLLLRMAVSQTFITLG